MAHAFPSRIPTGQCWYAEESDAITNPLESADVSKSTSGAVNSTKPSGMLAGSGAERMAKLGPPVKWRCMV